MKKHYLQILFCFLSSIGFSQSLYTDLLLHYPLDGNLNDIGGNSLDANGSVTYGANRLGLANRSAHFDGATSYADWPEDASLEIQYPLSVSFWVRYESSDIEKSFVFATDHAQNNYTGVWMSLTVDGYMALSFGDNTGNTSPADRRSALGTTLVSINQWHHVVGIINGPTDMQIFLDCQEETVTYVGTGLSTIGYSSNGGVLGQKDVNMTLPEYFFQGDLDDFMYWGRALTNADVNTLCQSSFVGVDELIKTEKVNVYPNPAKNELRWEGNEDFESYEVFNFLGEVVLKGNISTNKLVDISSLPRGVYAINFLSEARVLATTKFVKE